MQEDGNAASGPSSAPLRWVRAHPGIPTWLGLTLLVSILSALSVGPNQRLRIFLDALVNCGLFFGVIGGLIFLISEGAKASRKQKAERAVAAQAAELAAAQAAESAEKLRREQLRGFLLQPLRPVNTPALVLKKDELCYGQWPAEAYAMHKMTRYAGGSSGVSVRVARGVYLRNSGFRGAPISTQAMASIGRGTVYLTNTRVLFVGDSTTIEMPFTKIASTEPYSDGMRFNIANKSPIVLATGNNWLPLYFHRVQEGAFEGLSEDALPDELRGDSSARGAEGKGPSDLQQPDISAPPHTRIEVTMQGTPEKIGAALIQLRDGCQHELDIRAEDFQTIAELSAKADPSVTPAAALAAVRNMMQILSEALTRFQSAAVSNPSMDGKIRALITAFASFLESLLTLERQSREVPLPEAFTHTRSSILSLCQRILDQCEGWPALLSAEREHLGTRNECAISLEFDIDIPSVARAVEGDAQSVLRPA